MLSIIIFGPQLYPGVCNLDKTLAVAILRICMNYEQGSFVEAAKPFKNWR
jgi:hypothetical protein